MVLSHPHINLIHHTNLFIPLTSIIMEDIISSEIEMLAQQVLDTIASRKEAANSRQSHRLVSGFQAPDGGSAAISSDKDATREVVDLLDLLHDHLSQIGHIFLQSLNIASQAVHSFEKVRGDNRAYASTLSFEKNKILRALDTRTETKRLDMLKQQLVQNKQRLETLPIEKEALEVISAMHSGLEVDISGGQLKLREQREKFLELLSKKEAAIKDHQEVSTVEIRKVRASLKTTLDRHQRVLVECSTMIAMLDRSEAWWMELVEEREYAAGICDWIAQLKKTLNCNKSLEGLLNFVMIESD